MTDDHVLASLRVAQVQLSLLDPADEYVLCPEGAAMQERTPEEQEQHSESPEGGPLEETTREELPEEHDDDEDDEHDDRSA
jgi:hypothetical protein